MAKTIDEAKKEMREKAIRALEEGLLIIEADSKLLAPVKTGTLRRSITHQIVEEDNKTYGEVGSYGVEYAWFVEDKVPYLQPAVDQNIENIRKKIGEVLNGD